MLQFLSDHFITLFLVTCFAIKLYMRKKHIDLQINYFRMAIVCILILVATHTARSFLSSESSPVFLRDLVTVISLSVRPAAALCIMMILAFRTKWQWLFPLPAVINALLMCSQFFAPLVVIRGENGEDSWGPLFVVPFVVGFLYLVGTIWFIIKDYRNTRIGERIALYICAAACSIAVVIDIVGGGAHLNETFAGSIIILYMFLRSRDNRTDSLTGSRNRQAYYDDSEHYGQQVCALAMLDMNGLKRVNDEQGHEAGDRALKTIAEGIQQAIGKNTYSYRVGGDEFVLLFTRQSEEEVQSKLELVRTYVTASGLSISIGKAFRSGNEDMQHLYARADGDMYEDKAKYYSTKKLDRRRSYADNPARQDGPDGQNNG